MVIGTLNEMDRVTALDNPEKVLAALDIREKAVEAVEAVDNQKRVYWPTLKMKLESSSSVSSILPVTFLMH